MLRHQHPLYICHGSSGLSRGQCTATYTLVPSNPICIVGKLSVSLTCSVLPSSQQYVCSCKVKCGFKMSYAIIHGTCIHVHNKTVTHHTPTRLQFVCAQNCLHTSLSNTNPITRIFTASQQTSTHLSNSWVAPSEIKFKKTLQIVLDAFTMR